MKSKTVLRILQLIFALMVAWMVTLSILGQKVTIRDCTQKELVEDVYNCTTSRHSLTCSIKTPERQFRTDITEWPDKILQKGDEVFWCTRDVEYGATYIVNCKVGRCI